MADISLTDQLQVSAGLTISDASAFSLSQLTKLNFTNVPVVGDLAKPIDQCSFEQANFGAAFSSPGMLLGSAAALTVTAGETGTLFIRGEKSSILFESDGCAPDIPIPHGQCWVGLELSTVVGENVAAAFDGFGVSVSQSNEVRFGTHLLFTSETGPLPTLQQALKTLLESYAIATTASVIRSQPMGTVRTVATKGEACIGASYALPLSIDPLADASLPFQFNLAIQPSAAVQVSGSLKLTGEFVVRAYRETAATLIFGLYKKKATTLTAAFSAEAGIGVDMGTRDILTPVLNAVLPAADLQDMKLDPKQTEQLKTALKSCVDQSFAAALNARCSATVADEAAVVYSIDLTQASAQIDGAIGAALRGDWSAFEGVAGAKQIRNIAREIHDRNHRLNINLLGILNATSIHDYLQSSTVLQDGTGKIVLIDQQSAKSLSATETPYAAKADKLRSVLAQAFVTTISYGAAAGAAKGKLAIASFTIRQSFLDYKSNASAQDVRRYVLLARSLRLPVGSDWDAILQSDAAFNHAKCCMDAQYALADVMRVFYADPGARQPRKQQDLDLIGRNAKLALIDTTSDNADARRMALSSDTVWNAMCADGNTASFHSITGLEGLPETAIAAIAADWIDIRWWSDAMQQLPAKLTSVLQAIDNSTSGDPTKDAAFMARQKELQTALAHLTANTRSAFGDGWGMAVINRCASGAPFTQMDIGWNNQFEHYETGSESGAVASAG